ncbi:hypothetical protein FHV99_004714 [Ochrobactrum sp. P20RRXII]|nr:hypothetical protein [Ochrobactrum sp. P20RRXII]NIH77462.1 hypothetical protein [Ochrobactrum sp. P20RRXII]
MFTYSFYAVAKTPTENGYVDSSLTAKLKHTPPTYADLQAWQDYTKKYIEEQGSKVTGTPIITFFARIAEAQRTD